VQHVVGGVDHGGAGAAFVDRAVGDIDDRIVAGGLTEAAIDQELQIARRRRAWREIPRHDDALLLVQHLGQDVLADRCHVGAIGDRGNVGHPHAHLNVLERQNRCPGVVRLARAERT
jgi:hypothetical protein